MPMPSYTHPININRVFFHSAVIACKPSFPPYLAALNPTDQVFDFEELEYHYQVANRTEDAPSKEVDDDDDDADDADMIKQEKLEKDSNPDESMNQQATPVVDAVNAATTQNNSPTIDNPYLRAAKVPKRSKQDSVTITSSQ